MVRWIAGLFLLALACGKEAPSSQSRGGPGVSEKILLQPDPPLNSLEWVQVSDLDLAAGLAPRLEGIMQRRDDPLTQGISFEVEPLKQTLHLRFSQGFFAEDGKTAILRSRLRLLVENSALAKESNTGLCYPVPITYELAVQAAVPAKADRGMPLRNETYQDGKKVTVPSGSFAEASPSSCFRLWNSPEWLNIHRDLKGLNPLEEAERLGGPYKIIRQPVIILHRQPRAPKTKECSEGTSCTAFLDSHPVRGSAAHLFP